MKVISPFGPKIGKFKLSSQIIKKINIEVDKITEKKSLYKKLDYSKQLVGQVKQEFQLPKGQGSLFCRLKEQDETQQRVPLDVSEYTRKLIHVKVAKEQNGL